MKKEVILTVIFGILALVFIIIYAFSFFITNIPLMIKLLIFAVLLTVFSAMVYVIIQRINEIKQEGKDDLSKY